MAHKEVKKFSNAVVSRVERHALTGVIIEFWYEVEGSKHTTAVTHEIMIPFCDMRFVGGQFHIVMAELSKEWHDAKREISGKSD